MPLIPPFVQPWGQAPGRGHDTIPREPDAPVRDRRTGPESTARGMVSSPDPKQTAENVDTTLQHGKQALSRAAVDLIGADSVSRLDELAAQLGEGGDSRPQTARSATA